MKAGINRAFGQILQKFRKLKGFTQTQVAKELGVTRVSLANYESGTQSPPLEHVVRASVLLDFSLDELKVVLKKQGDFKEALADYEPNLRHRLSIAFDLEGIGEDVFLDELVKKGLNNGRKKKRKNRKSSD